MPEELPAVGMPGSAGGRMMRLALLRSSFARATQGIPLPAARLAGLRPAKLRPGGRSEAGWSKCCCNRKIYISALPAALIAGFGQASQVPWNQEGRGFRWGWAVLRWPREAGGLYDVAGWPSA